MNQHTQDTALEVVATLAGKVIDTRILEQKAEADLHRGLHAMFNQGVSIDSLSAASGLTVEQVRAAIEAEEGRLTNDLRALAGLS